MDEQRTDGRRRRDAAASRREILAAARSAFADLGYARATIREIAARAGVTHTLVMKHFPSKEQLFVAAMPGAGDLDHLLPATPDAVPQRIAAAYVERMERSDGSDPFIALIRTAATDDRAARGLYIAMRERSLEAYRALLDGPDVAERVDLLGAHLLGVTFSRYVVKAGPLAEMTPEDLVRHLSRTLHGILLAPDTGTAPCGC